MDNNAALVFVDHDQFTVGHAAADTLSVTSRGTLLEAGPGFVSVYTGISYGPARVSLELLSSEPDKSHVDNWEVVEEASLKSFEPIVVMSLDGTVAAGIEPIPAGSYIIRGHATGRDTHTGLEVTEPSETYHFQVWSATQPAAPAVETLRKVDRAWSQPDVLPQPVPAIPTPDFDYVYVRGEDNEILRIERDSDEAEAVRDWKRENSGRPLSPALKATAYARYLAPYDRNLLDRIEAGGDEFQRTFARWCARHAFDKAGLTDVKWLGDLLDAMDDGRLTLKDLGGAKQRLDDDLDIPKRLVSGLPAESAAVQQHQALNALGNVVMDGFSPLKSAVWAYRLTAQTYGMDYQELIDAANSAFPPAEP